MTTEHDEGFKAGIETAVTWYLANYQAYTRAGFMVEAIRALKPAPRSAEHTAEPSAQERERFEAWWATPVTPKELVDWTQDDSIKSHSWMAWQAALATAPSTRIEAEPVAVVVNNNVPGERMHLIRTTESHPTLDVGTKLYLDPPDRTTDARSTSDAAVVHLDHDPLGCEPCRPGWTGIASQYESGKLGRARDVRDDYIDLLKAHADRATRSTDSSAEAAKFNWCDFDDGATADAIRRLGVRNPTLKQVTQLQKDMAEAAKLTTDSSAEAARLDFVIKHFELGNDDLDADPSVSFRQAIDAKLTTAPHTADETRDTDNLSEE